ncbi:MAG: radical SAM protein [Candidatus Korarchaeum sp.]|nr:radical SAM protein [Candidatus Korarchaeum sp.]MDW8035666.1 radical SAM protein [Candidatus Korarchaeum sp.]
MYDPIELAEAVRSLVESGGRRKYYRFRGGKWYGGIATADCVGCNLRCVFCWSNFPRDKPQASWGFYSPEEVYLRLSRIASRRGYELLRISGNEPTICWDHLIELLELVESDGRFKFVLETNGILIGSDRSKAKDLSSFTKLHVRVSLKGACEEEFSILTGAEPEIFELQLRALENLADEGVSAHPAVMLSFSSEDSLRKLLERIERIEPDYLRKFEEEYVFLYPHVKERLKRAGLSPRVAYESEGVPEGTSDYF